jgi:hypothetical protein
MEYSYKKIKSIMKTFKENYPSSYPSYFIVVKEYLNEMEEECLEIKEFWQSKSKKEKWYFSGKQNYLKESFFLYLTSG